MSKNLVVVESPAKARTIERYLGPDFRVLASYGHVRDLPKSKLGVDVDHDFEPTYLVPKSAKKVISDLKAALKGTDSIYLATDLDREGEAIAWHLTEALGLTKGNPAIKRITFNEITKSAIEEAVKHPRGLNTDLVDAQQARRVLDRLVGYELSPLLWRKIRRGLSAGRVQSVALRLIVEREREIRAFKPEEYWDLEALFESDKATFKASLVNYRGEKLDKFAIPDAKTAAQVHKSLEPATWHIEKIETKQTRRNPSPPFTTSTLQQEAARKLHFSTRRTMTLAQQLYEGLELDGQSVALITYHRTDSANLSDLALAEAREVITKEFGKEYSLAEPRRFKSRKGAQEAHEAIRPTHMTRTPASIKSQVGRDHFRLYELIWKRAVASQMQPATLEQVGVDIEAGEKDLATFRATGQRIVFPGFLKLYVESTDEDEQSRATLPALKEGQSAKLLELGENQHFTEPPPRYSEASLVKALEEKEIGRPSTYSSIISTIQDRKYVELLERRFHPTEIGEVVSDFLVKNFEKIVNVDFTAEFEDKLDQIADGKLSWKKEIRDFYTPFHATLKEKESLDRVELKPVETDELCPVCGAKMVVKHGRFGEFLACSRYPDCKGTKPYVIKTGITCPKCTEGEVIERKTKKGRRFWGCSLYPECDYASWQKPKV
jgi:DNA topoisomerase-1